MYSPRDANYTGHKTVKNDITFFLARDRSNERGGVSMTNAIEEIASRHYVNCILYIDSEHKWTGWHKNVGFFEIKVSDTKTPKGIDHAINVFIFKLISWGYPFVRKPE